MSRPWRRLSAAQLNGIAVALGVALTQALIAALFGMPAGLAAVGGAVCASLPDLPNPPRRIWPRVLPAAFAAALVTALIGFGQRSLPLMIALVALISFVSLLSMAWGPRAGPLSFSAVLAMVFAMAWHAPADAAAIAAHAGWVLLGGLVYALWARAMSLLLQRRYGELALAGALRATERRLRSRAVRIAGTVTPAEASIRASIADDVLLAEALQAARDQVFAAPPSPRSRRQTEALLGLIELRDLLLASRLDTELLGADEPGRQWRAALATTLLHLADALAGFADAVALGAPLCQVSAARWREELAARLAGVAAPADDARHHLVDALQARLGHMLDDVEAMGRRLAGDELASSAWSAEQLQMFVSPEGWPLAALKAHLNLGSPVMRHALRAGLALSLAYALGHVLPWAAHPYWLMLSVAVVLRGNLEQTLSRRNERIIGTVLGCLLVLLIAQVHERHLLSLVFIAAVGTAHAYVNRRYRVAATAATLMALLQPLMLAPGSNPAIAERLADTVIGALLAWAFCFVLPSWERRSLARLVPLLRGALARHAANMLRWAPTPEQQLSARLSRQQAYAALAALAAAAQRTRVEPAHVRLPEDRIEAVLSHGYRLMALLGALQHLMGRRGEKLDAEQAQAALGPALRDCVAALKQEAGMPAAAVAGEARELLEEPDADAGVWPEHLGQQDLTPWLLRRLRLCRREARALSAALLRLPPAA
ncbi:FUSC family protein [Roseateles violae]|uniref:FUSC family protein n=1 Tax=Roseateles violae TaxID=3058042 RepID=A0ABT8DMG0_9BURK|nr:FUSC family protein [Pelomonas sp. PFR6]MDN3919587.1 FUSC family protein [Pelomonas sp. PFR6]